MDKRIILASSSAQRKLLMDSLGVPYEIIPANINEKAIRDDDLKLRAKKIAKAKGESVASSNHGIIIASDTFSFFKDKVLEKPRDIEEATQMLTMISGKKIISLTGFFYVDMYENRIVSEVAETELWIRKLSSQEIESYVQSSPVLTWAAAFAVCYPYGASLVEEIRGSLTGCSYGLPAEFLIPQLELSGIKIAPK